MVRLLPRAAWMLLLVRVNALVQLCLGIFDVGACVDVLYCRFVRDKLGLEVPNLA
jgi:hypothetical protein